MRQAVEGKRSHWDVFGECAGEGRRMNAGRRGARCFAALRVGWSGQQAVPPPLLLLLLLVEGF